MASKITDRAAAKHVLDRHGFRFQKKYGQNFLLDVDLLDEIAAAAEVSEQDYVVEIGPGMGSLTARLARRAKKVFAIEIDPHLIPILRETLADYDNIEIINADVMKVDLREIIGGFLSESAAPGASPAVGIPPVKFVANLPYYITTPIIMRLLEEGGYAPQSDETSKEADGHAATAPIPYQSITVMVQREVAERMTCAPGGKEYGALTLAVQYYTSPEIVRRVPAGCFFPPPKVESAVVRMTRHEKPPVEVSDEGLLFQLIRAAFNQRRKTLVNGLHNGAHLPFSKEEYAGIISECGWETNIRGEKLSLADFARLTNALAKRRVIE